MNIFTHGHPSPPISMFFPPSSCNWVCIYCWDLFVFTTTSSHCNNILLVGFPFVLFRLIIHPLSNDEGRKTPKTRGLNAKHSLTLIYYIPFWHQVIRDATPIESGIRLLPFVLGLLLTLIISGGLVSKFGYCELLEPRVPRRLGDEDT